ncbi:hypothetical protein OHW26_09165, partial [Acinetobacter baumannii]|nr:hypothetical protein [Acinetobacter baumannii]
MTVPVSDRLSQLYVGNGVNTRFDFIFRIFQQEDENGVTIRVKTGTEFEELDKSLYQVILNPDDMGGYVLFNVAPTNQTYFYIAGQTPVDQLLDITNYDNFYPDAIEKALDKLTAILQEWNHLLDAEKQSRILADIYYDDLAKLREDDIKIYLLSVINQHIDDFNDYKAYIEAKLQEAIKNGTVSALAIVTVECVEDLPQVGRWNGRTVYVKSFYRGSMGTTVPYKGGGTFIFDGARISENDGGVCINGWVRQLENRVLNPYMFGAYGDLQFTSNEVLAYQTGHDDTEAFKKMLNMNKYVIFTNISKAVSSNKYSTYTFEIPHAAYYIKGTLPIRAFTKIEGNNSTIFFDPDEPIDLFQTPRSEMQEAYQISTGWNTQTIPMCEFSNLIIVGNVTRTSTTHAQKCFDAANAYKWRWSNILIERFHNGISIYPLDT